MATSRIADTDMKLEFVRQATERMAEHTHRYIASIVGDDGATHHPHVGSALRVDGRRAIVTAAHVYREAHQRFGEQVAASAQRGQPPTILRAPRMLDDALDIAVFDVPDNYSTGGVAFWPPDRATKDDSKLSSDYLFLHGFPGVRSHFSALANGLLNRSFPYGVMQREDELPPNLGEHQFAMDFDPENFQALDGTSGEWLDPSGLSGSAVWRIGAAGASMDEWSPAMSTLVGVVTHWDQSRKCLIATKWTEVASLLG